MSFDFRRFNGPENSVSYKHYLKDRNKSTEKLSEELFNENGLRKDGRALDEARSLCRFFGRTEIISQAKGSAYVELNRTKVVCSVFDPREIPHQNEFSKLGQLKVEVKFAPFSCPRRRRPYMPDTEDKSMSAELKQALEPVVCRQQFPNLQIDIYVYILEHDGACLAAAINAAGLALADARVPMYDIITACSAAVLGDDVLVDPTEAEEFLALKTPEEGTNHGIVTLSMLHTLKQISNVTLTGSIDVLCVTNVTDTLEKECTKMVPNIKQILVSNVEKNFEARKAANEEIKIRDKTFDENLKEWAKLM